MSKCEACKIQCGNSWCPYIEQNDNEKIEVEIQIRFEGGLQGKLKKTLHEMTSKVMVNKEEFERLSKTGKIDNQAFERLLKGEKNVN